jgi:hypothetical protein
MAACEHRTLDNGFDEYGTFCLDCGAPAKRIIHDLRAERDALRAKLARVESELSVLAEALETQANDFGAEAGGR